jgi:hypothetical protein
MSTSRSDQKYSSRIIKAGAILSESKLILDNWDLGKSPEDNLKRIMEENLVGKQSRTRTAEIVKAFRQRFCSDVKVLESLCLLSKGRIDHRDMNTILFFMTAQADPLLYGTVTEFLPHYQYHPDLPITTPSLISRLKIWLKEGRMLENWSDATVKRVAEGLLSTLRDFGILTGQNRKTIAAFSVPPKAFAFISAMLFANGLSGRNLLHSEKWAVLLLSTAQVEREFIEANQLHLLNYNAMGSVVRIDYPTNDLGEYAHALV